MIPKPCGCGKSFNNPYWTHTIAGWRVQCSTCPASTTYYETREAAIAAWNRSNDYWQSITTAPWNTDLLLGWHGMNGEWKTEVGWAGRSNTCPKESGASNGWQHGNATHWCWIPEFRE